jgi:hypothetical protein
MNASFSFARAFVTDETVCIAMELFAEELTTEQISYACGLITFAADHWDDELKRSFGGETFFEGPADETPRTPRRAARRIRRSRRRPSRAVTCSALEGEHVDRVGLAEPEVDLVRG